MCGYVRRHWKAQDYSICIVLYPFQVGCYIMSRTKMSCDLLFFFLANSKKLMTSYTGMVILQTYRSTLLQTVRRHDLCFRERRMN